MQLIQKQEWMLQRYLNDVVRALEPDTNARTAEKAIARLRGRIEGQLRAKDGAITEETVQQLPASLGSPAAVARDLLAETGADQSDRKWLGVCGWIAEKFDLPPWFICGVVFLIGLGTGPYALFAYATAYLFLRFAGALSKPGRIRWFMLVGRPILTIIYSLALFAGTKYALQGVNYARDRWLKRPLPDLGQWGWYFNQQGTMLFWTLVMALSLAVLGSLPIAGGWGITLFFPGNWPNV